MNGESGSGRRAGNRRAVRPARLYPPDAAVFGADVDDDDHHLDLVASRGRGTTKNRNFSRRGRHTNADTDPPPAPPPPAPQPPAPQPPSFSPPAVQAPAAVQGPSH